MNKASQEFGRLEAKVDLLLSDVADIKAGLKKNSETVSVLEERVDNLKHIGIWILSGSGLASIVACIFKFMR